MRTVLFEKLKTANHHDKNYVAMLLAADRFSEVLAVVNGQESMTRVLADIKRAKPINTHTTQVFVEIFAKQIRNSLEFLIDKEQNAASTEKALYQRSRAELCLGLLAAETWPKKVSKDLCLGLKLSPLIKGGPSSKPIDESLIEAEFQKRACAYQNYMRDSLIYERWKIK